MRGRDLTGDGLEDFVVSRNVAVTGGTLRSFAYFIVTRTRPGGPLRVVTGFPKDQMGLDPSA